MKSYQLNNIFKDSPNKASLFFTPSEAYFFPLAGIDLLANAPGCIKLLGNTDLNLPPNNLNTTKLTTPQIGISLEETAIVIVLFGIKECNFSVNVFIKPNLISFNGKTLERKTREAVVPAIITDIPPQTEPIIRRFEVIRSGRNNPFCRTPKQRGNVIPPSALGSTVSATCIWVQFSSVKRTRFQILSPTTRAFWSAFRTISSAMLVSFLYPDSHRLN